MRVYINKIVYDATRGKARLLNWSISRLVESALQQTVGLAHITLSNNEVWGKDEIQGNKETEETSCPRAVPKDANNSVRGVW